MTRKARRNADPGATPAPPRETITPSRRRIFTAVIVLLPIILLALTELLLRAIDYGGEQRLVLQKKVGGREVYIINRTVARRYFAHSGGAVPEPAEDTFEISKQKQTKRIFCLGESTMAGFPFDFNATAPSFLRDRLAARFHGFNVEVVNVGLSAVGSYVVLDFIRELADYQPDLYIVYVGHNEFYGAYGVGSTVQAGGGHTLTRLTIRLLHYRIFLLVRDAVVAAQGVFSRKDVRRSGTMMEQVVAEQVIPYDSDLYRKARAVYRDNLEAIIDVAQSSGVPILFSTLVSNLKDQPPLRPGFSARTSADRQAQWKEFVSRGDSCVRASAPTAALGWYAKAVDIDSTNALGVYRLGTAQISSGSPAEARQTFLRARDLDELRFRMSGQFQQDLRDVCSRRRVPIADVDSAFAANSPGGITGRELILEHLHPTIGGYFLMAKTWAAAMESHGLVAAPAQWIPDTTSDPALFDRSAVAEFDTLLGQVRVKILTHQWPFVEGPSEYSFTPANDVERIVYDYAKGKLFWSKARYMMADLYASRKEWPRARRECRALARQAPYSYDPLLRIADYYRQEGDTAHARLMYERSLSVEDNSFARARLALMALEGNDAATAASQIQAAFTSEARTPRFTAQQTASAHYVFAVALARLGDIPRARAEAETAIAIDPSQDGAKELLREIQRGQGGK